MQGRINVLLSGSKRKVIIVERNKRYFRLDGFIKEVTNQNGTSDLAEEKSIHDTLEKTAVILPN